MIYLKDQQPNNEEKTVQECWDAVKAELNRNYTPGHDYVGKFDIIIDGKQLTFLIGGPQAQGLFLMLDNIAKENGYEINW